MADPFDEAWDVAKSWWKDDRDYNPYRNRHPDPAKPWKPQTDPYEKAIDKYNRYNPKPKMCYMGGCTNVATTEAVRLVGGELKVVPACETCAERNNITGGEE